MSKTIRQVFDEALACETKEQADQWLGAEIERHRVEFNQTPSEARSVILKNLGYYAGYYDDATAQKIYRLYGANHPIVGGHDYHKTVTPEQAVDIGKKLGEKLAKEKQ